MSKAQGISIGVAMTERPLLRVSCADQKRRTVRSGCCSQYRCKPTPRNRSGTSRFGSGSAGHRVAGCRWSGRPPGGHARPLRHWIKLAGLIPWDELEDDDAAQFRKDFRAPAKRFRVPFGALIIKARLGLTDEELVEQIRKSSYLQFFIGFAGFQSSESLDPSTIMYFIRSYRMPS